MQIFEFWKHNIQYFHCHIYYKNYFKVQLLYHEIDFFLVQRLPFNFNQTILYPVFWKKKRNNQYIDFNNNTKRTDQVISTCTASLLQLHRKEADIFAHIMFHVAITLIMHLVPFGEPILGENICQNFIKISIPPSASCKMSKTSTQNLGNCFQSCMVYNGSSNMISRNAYTTECLCCQDVPSEDVFSSGNWISYSFGKS